MITTEQIAHFNTFGVIVLRQLFSKEEMVALTKEFDDVLANARDNKPFDGKKRQSVQPFVENRELLTQMVEDDRIFITLEQLLGPGFLWMGSDGNLYVGDTQWHADRLQGDGDHLPWDLNSIKVCLYFDPVDSNTGCLRVIPGTHRREFGERLEPIWRNGLEPDDKRYGLPSEKLPCASLESRPGDAVFFSQGMCHSSFGGDNGRRMLAMSVLEKPTKNEHINFIKRFYARTNFTFRPAESWVNSNSPRIHGMVRPLLDMGFDISSPT